MNKQRVQKKGREKPSALCAVQTWAVIFVDGGGSLDDLEMVRPEGMRRRFVYFALVSSYPPTGNRIKARRTKQETQG